MTMGVKDINPQPVLTAPVTTAGSRIYWDRYNSGRSYDSLTGKRYLGLCDAKDGAGDLKPVLASVEAGAVVNSLAEIITGWGGNYRAAIQEYSTRAMEAAGGTSASAITQGYDTTPIVGDIAASGSTVNMIQLGSGDAAAFVGAEGRPLEIAGVGRNMIGYLAEVNADDDELHLLFPLDEVPTASGVVKVLKTFTQEMGGNTSRQGEFINAIDFGNGASHRLVIWRGQSVGGVSFTAQNGIVKTPIDIKILGHTRTVASRAQMIPATNFGTYGTADLGL